MAENHNFGLNDNKEKTGFSEYIGKYVLFSGAIGRIAGKLERVDDNYFGHFSEIWTEDKKGEISKFVKKQKKFSIDLRSSQANCIEEMTEEEINNHFSEFPENKEYFGKWIRIPEKKVVGKVSKVTRESLELCPSLITDCSENGEYFKLEYEIPSKVPNDKLVIEPISEEGAINTSLRSKKKLEEKVKE